MPCPERRRLPALRCCRPMTGSKRSPRAGRRRARKRSGVRSLPEGLIAIGRDILVDRVTAALAGGRSAARDGALAARLDEQPAAQNRLRIAACAGGLVLRRGPLVERGCDRGLE